MAKVSLRYALWITGPAYGTQQATSAYQFAHACIAAGHQLKILFFYHDGVYNANRLVTPAGDEFDLVRGWQRLAQQFGVVLWICHGAALRRGVVGEMQGGQEILLSLNVLPEFTIIGLTGLTAITTTCDRLIQF